MERSKINFAAVFSLIVLLIYSYIAFLGLVYWKNGNIFIPIMITLGFIAIVICSILAMCASKATRWQRIGNIGQVIFGFIIFVVFIFSAIPFANFIRVVENHEKIYNEIKNTLNSADSLDESYNRYANDRINNYADKLEFVSSGKSIRPSEYEECMGGAYGDNDNEKINNLKKSLKMKLLPDTITVVQNRRHEWLQSASNMSVWNIMLPSNLQKINEEVKHWTDNYVKLSDVAYKGENAEKFSYSEFNSSLSNLTAIYTKLHKPTIMSLILALIGFAIMLLPYFVTEDSLEGKKSKNDSVYE